MIHHWSSCRTFETNLGVHASDTATAETQTDSGPNALDLRHRSHTTHVNAALNASSSILDSRTLDHGSYAIYYVPDTLYYSLYTMSYILYTIYHRRKLRDVAAAALLRSALLSLLVTGIFTPEVCFSDPGCENNIV